jgi:acetyltransferase-like isoleucine patch superfamily enzyme
MNKTEKYTRAFFNRLFFFPYKHRFSSCGSRVLIETPFIINGESKIKIGNNVRIKQGLHMEAISEHLGTKYEPEIVIGDNVSINYDVHIAAIDKVVIEDDVLIASKVFISDHSHGNTEVESLKILPSKRQLYSKGPVQIKKGAWIGENVSILSGVTIGENSVIGANSVVTKNVDANCVVAGCPAKVIRLNK